MDHSECIEHWRFEEYFFLCATAQFKKFLGIVRNSLVLSVKHSNHLTRTADVPDELKSTVASGEDNTVELQLWTAAQDQLRGIVRWDYYR